jgi:hypothetical protein
MSRLRASRAITSLCPVMPPNLVSIKLTASILESWSSFLIFVNVSYFRALHILADDSSLGSDSALA